MSSHGQMRRAAYKARRKQREERAARELEAAQLRQRLDAYEAKKQAEYAALYDNRQRPAEEVQPPTKEEAELVAHMEKWDREPPRILCMSSTTTKTETETIKGVEMSANTTMIQILHRFTRVVIFQAAVETVKDAVLLAISRGANLEGASLYGANLEGANLDGANLTRANLTRASLYGANLTHANLTRANLTRASLTRANLEGASLTRANLEGANLDGANLDDASLTRANLEGASLTRANLEGANLYGANLTRASLPSPTAVLLASWGAVSDQLCADLMLWDSMNHPDATMFDRWALGGACPYGDVNVGRAANFDENRALWGKGVSTSPYQLMRRLLGEKCPEWTDEEKASFERRCRGSSVMTSPM